jgi:hypothetical protein
MIPLKRRKRLLPLMRDCPPHISNLSYQAMPPLEPDQNRSVVPFPGKRGEGAYSRPVTPAERTALPLGLLAEMPDDVVLKSRHHPLSHVSRWLRGYAVILVRGKTIFWPNLPRDMSRNPVLLSVLAHELVHVWQYRTGMTLFSYVIRDLIGHRGRYAYELIAGKPYRDYGYEQQAAMMEDWVRLHHGLAPRYGRDIALDDLTQLLPFVGEPS